MFHLSVAAEVYHQVATLHLVAGSQKARERTERTVRKVCEFAEIKLGEYRRILRRMERDGVIVSENGSGPEGGSGSESFSEVEEDGDSKAVSDEATDEDEDVDSLALSEIESIEGESVGESVGR